MDYWCGVGGCGVGGGGVGGVGVVVGGVGIVVISCRFDTFQRLNVR